MKKGFYSTMFLLLIICSIVVASITYYKVQKGLKEGWTGQSSGGVFDTNYIGGLGWGKGYGDWDGVQLGLGLQGDGTLKDASGGWTPPGWSVLFKGEEVGGVGVDQVFHTTSLEGEMGNNFDSPSVSDTLNRLGGGWSRSNNPLWQNGNSIIPPSGAPDDSYGKINGDLTFYAPGSYMYGADNYVPSYAASVLLSPMIGVNAPLRPIRGEGQGGGRVNEMVDSVCSPDSGASVLDMEAYCQKLSPEDASSKTCCVALGGKHAMSGNDQGPYNRSIYTNPMVSGATDYYIHLGKCYGNCPSSYSSLSGASV